VWGAADAVKVVGIRFQQEFAVTGGIGVVGGFSWKSTRITSNLSKFASRDFVAEVGCLFSSWVWGCRRGGRFEKCFWRVSFSAPSRLVIASRRRRNLILIRSQSHSSPRRKTRGDRLESLYP